MFFLANIFFSFQVMADTVCQVQLMAFPGICVAIEYHKPGSREAIMPVPTGQKLEAEIGFFISESGVPMQIGSQNIKICTYMYMDSGHDHPGSPRIGQYSQDNVIGLSRLYLANMGDQMKGFWALEIRYDGKLCQFPATPGAYDRIEIPGTGDLESRQVEDYHKFNSLTGLYDYVPSIPSARVLKLDHHHGGQHFR